MLNLTVNERWGSKPNPTRAETGFEITASSSPLAIHSSVMSALTIHGWWEDEMARERLSTHTPLRRKMKLLALETQGCLRTSLRDCSSSFSNSRTDLLGID